MKNNKFNKFSLLFLIVSLVVVSSVLSNPLNDLSIKTPLTATPHAKINIVGNTALDAFCSGDGTDGLSWETAHVIQDLEIDAGDDEALVIQETNRYLIIKNCELTGARDGYGAVRFMTCININITQCTIGGGNFDLLEMYHCKEIDIRDNEISGIGYGVCIWTNNTNIYVTGNTINAATGVQVRYSEYCNVTYNTGTVTGFYGILLGDGQMTAPEPPRYNTVTCNKFTGSNLKEQVKDEGEFNYVYDNPCPIIPGFSWIIVVAVALSVTSILAVRFLIKRKNMK